MAYYECLSNNDHINIGDKFSVSLTGSQNTTITASVCYIDKNTICLLRDGGPGGTTWVTACNYIWNYSVNINNKEYTGTCRIPTLEQIYSKCAGFYRGFNYWLSKKRDSSRAYYVTNIGSVEYIDIDVTFVNYLPFIEITL